MTFLSKTLTFILLSSNCLLNCSVSPNETLLPPALFWSLVRSVWLPTVISTNGSVVSMKPAVSENSSIFSTVM